MCGSGSHHLRRRPRRADSDPRRRRPIRALVAAAFVAAGCVACAPGAGSRVDDSAAETLARNEAAVDELRFGMTEAEAARVMGTARMTPPWANRREIGPQTVENPFDRYEIESPSGDTYTVERYATWIWGQPECPFVRGEMQFVPLVFLERALVGWRWSYLESALGRPLTADERGYQFGGFCNAPPAGASDSAVPAEPGSE